MLPVECPQSNALAVNRCCYQCICNLYHVGGAESFHVFSGFVPCVIINIEALHEAEKP